MRSSYRSRNTYGGRGGGFNMDKTGGIIALITNILYLLGAGASGYFIRETLKEGETVDIELYMILIVCILMPIIVLSIYFIMDKSSESKKENVNNIIGWTSIAPICILCGLMISY